MRNYLLGIIFLFCATSFAQQYPTVINLRSKVLSNATVKIEFTISTSTFTVGGWELQRSTDSLFGYTIVNTYIGSVGGGTTQDFFYDDYPPDPTKKYYYKVRLANGVESNIIVVNMANVFGYFKIIPHPITDFSRLEFVYTLGQNWVLEIADPKGYFIYRDEYVYTGSYPLSKSIFKQPGIYFFRLYLIDGSQVIRGRMVVM